MPDFTFVIGDRVFYLHSEDYVLPEYIDKTDIVYCRLGIAKGGKDKIELGVKFVVKYNLILNPGKTSVGI